MLEDNQVLNQNNPLMDIMKNKKAQTRFDKNKKIILILSAFFSLIIIGVIYFSLDVSKIKQININGNYYLSDNKILEISELSKDDRFLLTMPWSIKRKIEQNVLIQETKVDMLDGLIVDINVKEKAPIGYAYENGSNVLILDNDERITIDNENISLITKVPLLEGFSGEELVLIEQNIKECDKDIINEISEIHKYPNLKYQYVEIIMRDGNYIFTSPYGLKMLNKYYDIESSYIKDKYVCYYFEDISGNAYTSACPWEPVEEVKVEESEDIEEE